MTLLKHLLVLLLLGGCIPSDPGPQPAAPVQEPSNTPDTPKTPDISETPETPQPELACDMRADPCGPRHFCNYNEGTCKHQLPKGTCTIVPEICPTIYQPVCGCDGQTYSNRCAAQTKRVSIEAAGECKAP